MAEQFSVRLVDEDGNTDTIYGNVQVMHLGLWRVSLILTGSFVMQMSRVDN